MYIFQKYYLGLKLNQRELEFEGKKVMLSPKTKGFCYLLEKNKFSKIKFVNIIKNMITNIEKNDEAKNIFIEFIKNSEIDLKGNNDKGNKIVFSIFNNANYPKNNYDSLIIKICFFFKNNSTFCQFN